ncbi:MAG TPA: hypothetical protein VIF44_05755 [Candidatus Limnocylindrales bacterium]
MQRRALLLVVAVLVVDACQAASSPSASPSLAIATSTPAANAPSPAAHSPTEATPSNAAPTAEGTLTPVAPDPGVSQSATWWLDPASLPIDPQTTRLRGFVQERACASGQSPEGRILKPDIDYGAEALTVTFSIAPLAGDQDCLGNEPFGVVFELAEPVGGRPILDGSTTPARDATTIPET